jgi:hypothetical protein
MIRFEAVIRGAAFANAISLHIRQIISSTRPSSKVPEDP